MGENKGKGVKGRGYDELSGVGTSNGGITGTTGNLNTAGRDGGIGEPPLGDAGNRQSHGEPDGTPALGRGTRTSPQSRQGGQGQNSQSGSEQGSQGIGASNQGQESQGSQSGAGASHTGGMASEEQGRQAHKPQGNPKR